MIKKEKDANKIKKVKELQSIFYEYGPRSKEFHEQVYKFVYKIIQKHYFNFNNQLDKEDIIQLCFVRMYQSFDYFDPNKGNLATFIYYNVRNSILSDLLEKERINKITYHNNDENYEFDFDNVEANYDYLYEFNLSCLNILLNTKNFKLSYSTISDFINMKNPQKYHFLLRYVKWKQITMN